MARFFIDSRIFEYSRNDAEVNRSNLEEDFPFKLGRWKPSRSESKRDINMVAIRRWVERSASGDVYFSHEHKCGDNDYNSSTIVEYFWDIYFECEDDILLFKLTWE